MKTCNKCKETKELTEFHKRKDMADGLRSECKACRCLKEKQRYTDDYDRMRAVRKEYFEANRELCNQRSSEYLAANRKRLNEQCRAYNKANREAILEQQAAYRAANPAKVNANAAKSRCGSAAPSWLDDSHHEAILCVYEVADALDYQVDHIVPRNHPLVSGLHVAWNLQPLPPANNMRKRNYLPLEPQYSFIHQHDGKAYDSALEQAVTIN
jgi:5-methylcytosine-specific restriction endonuclease McrA